MRSSLALLILLAPAAEAQAKGVLHRVRQSDETYADIADHYYGKRYLERHLKLFNRRPEPLKKGTTIIIPTYQVVPVKRGQSLRSFAGTHLNDPGRAPYLAELHRLRGREQQNPRPGKRLRVVQSLKHVVRRGESIESIAQLYYRDASKRRIRLLTLYNQLKSPSVRRGQAIRIPLDTSAFNRSVVSRRAQQPFSVKPVVAKASPPPPPPPPAKTAKARKRQSKRDARAERRRFAQRLEEAERLYGNGQYEDTRKVATDALANGPDGSPKTRTELLRLQAFAEIALGEYGSSKATFKALLQVSPKYELDLYQTSPKILDIFQAVAMR